MWRNATTVMLIALVLGLGAAPARAGSRKVGGGQVALAASSLGSGHDPALVKKVKKASHGRAVFHEKDGAWKIHYAVALAGKLPSAELTLRISDVSRGKKFVGTRDKMVFDDRPVIGGSFSLARDEVFDPNAKLLVEIESGGVLVASRVFYIQGKAEQLTGEVAFGADEGTTDEPDERAGLAGKKRRQ